MQTEINTFELVDHGPDCEPCSKVAQMTRLGAKAEQCHTASASRTRKARMPVSVPASVPQPQGRPLQGWQDDRLSTEREKVRVTRLGGSSVAPCACRRGWARTRAAAAPRAGWRILAPPAVALLPRTPVAAAACGRQNLIQFCNLRSLYDQDIRESAATAPHSHPPAAAAACRAGEHSSAECKSALQPRSGV